MTIKLSKAGKMPCESWSLEAYKTCPASFVMALKNNSYEFISERKELVDACKGCYAAEGNYRFQNVKDAREHNRTDWQRDEWVDEMVVLLDNNRYFRWFDSGDMYHIKLAYKILEVMKRTEFCKHWLPTRMYKFKKFSRVIEEMQALPNVSVRFSSDSVTGRVIAGKTTSTIVEGLQDIKDPDTKKLVGKVFIGVVPKGAELCRAFERNGKCEMCRACWNKETQVIAYPAHGNKMKRVLKEITA